MNKNEIFTLWIPNNDEKKLPLLAHLSLKSMVLCGHDVILYTYCPLENIPQGVSVLDANEIIDQSKIFRYKDGHKTYSGFANLFRLRRLYELGGTWLDLDVVLIRNINEKFDDNIIICSEPTKVYYSKPNNAVVRFPPKDPFVKSMLEYAEKRGSDIIHGETGPTLVLKTLKGSLYSYNRHLKNFNFNNLLHWKYLNDYSMPPKELLNNVNMDEVIGFHLVNTFFDKILTSENPQGLFEILKRVILNSNSKSEYYNALKENNILKTTNDTFKQQILKYLENSSTANYKYTIIIDAKNLKKIEIYNILHSIAYDDSFDDLMGGGHDSLSDKQFLIFGKTNLANDKIKFKDNILLLPIDFNDISFEINDYIKGNYVIPLNTPLIFKPNFFIEKAIKADIEHYHTNNQDLNVNILTKNSYLKLLNQYGSKNIFNLKKEMITEFNFEEINEDILNYEYRSENAIKMMKLIDKLDEIIDNDPSALFLQIKHELMELDFKNLIAEVSYHYFTAYNNIMNSSYYYEYRIMEEKTRLKCMNETCLNRLNKYNV